MEEQPEREMANEVAQDLTVPKQINENADTANIKTGKTRRPRASGRYLYRLAVIIPVGGLFCASLFALTAWSNNANSLTLNPLGGHPKAAI